MKKLEESKTKKDSGVVHWKDIIDAYVNKHIKTPDDAITPLELARAIRFMGIKKNTDYFSAMQIKDRMLRLMAKYRRYDRKFRIICVPVPEKGGTWCVVPLQGKIGYRLLHSWAHDYVSRELGYYLGSDRNIEKLQDILKEYPELRQDLNLLIVQLRARRRNKNMTIPKVDDDSSSSE